MFFLILSMRCLLLLKNEKQRKNEYSVGDYFSPCILSIIPKVLMIFLKVTIKFL